MCGIMGYVGARPVAPILVAGLERLEYRGYDSSGIATVEAGHFIINRAVGKLSNLKAILEKNGAMCTASDCAHSSPHVGIGHTRWATHGRPSQENAHPHIAGKICVVHNGIVENYLKLKKFLQEQGCQFSSETDTEIAAHLINLKYSQSADLAQAVYEATQEIEGSYALVVISCEDPGTIIVAKSSSPVILGLGEGENFVASDIPAILEHTRQMIVLEDGDIAVVQADSVSVTNHGQVVERDAERITWDPITAEKGGFRHFMLKEIYEQPQVITDTFRSRIEQEKGDVVFDNIKISAKELSQIERVSLVGCGTAWHAALVTKFYLEEIAGIPADVDYGSEFRYRPPFLSPKTLFVAVSQSGETADTLGSLQVATGQGASTLAICNVVGSSISRKAQNVIYTHAGPEISVASTKAFVTQCTVGYLLAIHLGLAKGRLTQEQAREHIAQLIHLPTCVTEALERNRQVEKIARKYGRSEHFLFLGRGILYPIALEGALKLKEISYIHAEGYPAGEMKHGPIALINEETPVVIVFGHRGLNYDKTMSNLMEVESRGGRIIAVTDVETPQLKELAWETIAIGEVAPNMLPIALTVPLQLLAYHVAVYRGTDVDQPRNLAKSVTVE